MSWWNPANVRRRGIGWLRLGLHESELPLDQDERHATWLELFFDLVFVLALATVQNRLDVPTPHLGDLAATLGLFAVVWLAWIGQAFYDTRFDPDDLIHRLAVLVGMIGAGAMAVGAASAPHTLLLPIGYIVVRVMLIVLYLRVRNSSPATHLLTTVYLIGFGAGVLVWVVSLAVPERIRPLLWAIALTIEFLTPWLGRSRVTRIPVDTSHLPERIGQFTIILLGTTLTDLRDAIAPRPEVDVVMAAAVALVIPAAVWWVYTTFVTTGLALPRLSAGLAYSYVHSFLGAALLLLGWGLGEVVGQISVHADAAPDRLRLLLAVALIVWMLCGLGLQWVSLGYIPRRRAIIGVCGIAPIVVITTVVTDPFTLLCLLAVVLVAYAIVVSRHIAHLGDARAATT
ncbi:low temperature requirement protein A [Micromonospora sp. NBC_01796]|uniref:low temperature requirement protein A n=1 Tax=Micromonospora sp. NBC_01796 TaxID=2975987 RepID=UPI002DD820AB|nr:low temperature requirement protein A [Micromonospora sp. NBC_01796]WSA83007.1 low temperature requirement protein A [Micromonospora sp. NBC_01796]